MPPNRTTRTLNPLHFEDLEPHRFEDLVRQLAYDFRPWATIEATGRSGSDEGVDIRAVERLPVSTGESTSTPEREESEEEPEEVERQWEERTWIIQCKREKTVTPAKALKIMDESLPASGTAPYGFIIAAAADMSAKTRQAFRDTLRMRDVSEVVIWGKAELEDLLFQPKNDHLLFAYFGISLQTRRRSRRSLLGARLTLKRRLVKVLGDVRQRGYGHEPVLIRDANSTEYPHPKDADSFKKHPMWRYFNFAGHLRVDHVAFVIKEYWAWANFDEEYWDYLEKYDQGMPRFPELAYGPTRPDTDYPAEENSRRFWLTKVPEGERAMLKEIGLIHYDRIVSLDEVGDRIHPPPHLLVDCLTLGELFDDRRVVIEGGVGLERRQFFPDQAKRRQLFPKTIPRIADEDFHAGLNLPGPGSG